jgi:hypothetical protein
MKWLKRKLFERRKRNKIKLTFRGDDCIKAIVPGSYGATGGQVMEIIKMKYGFYRPLGMLGEWNNSTTGNS